MSKEGKGFICWMVFFILSIISIVIIGFKATIDNPTYCRYEYIDHNNETGIADICIKVNMYCRLKDGTNVAVRRFKFTCYEVEE